MQEVTEEANLPTQGQFDAWMGTLPDHVADVVRNHSPFVPHRLKKTGQTVFISRFTPGETANATVTLSVVAPRSANPGQVDDQHLEGIGPDDLYTLAS